MVHRTRTNAWAVLVMSILAVGATAGRATYETWSHSGSQYLTQKFLFTLATTIDLPMIQALFAGLGLVWYGRRSDRLPGGHT